MGATLRLSRLQKRGQVTIPIEIRQRLGLEEGDMLAFIETREGIVISPQEVVPAETLNQMTAYLQGQGVALKELFEFSDRLAEEEGKEAKEPASVSGVAKQTAGIFQRPGQKPADFEAMRHEFIEGTARNVRTETQKNSE